MLTDLPVLSRTQNLSLLFFNIANYHLLFPDYFFSKDNNVANYTYIDYTIEGNPQKNLISYLTDFKL